MPDPALARLARRSVELIRAHQASSGAYPACPTFPPYRFCWLRDGSFIADAMSRVGQVVSAEAFFRWCAGVLEARAQTVERLVEARERGEPVDPAEHLRTRYALDGGEPDLDWANYQLDGWGAWIWALAGHVERHGRDAGPFARAAGLSARYVAAFWEEPCYDWWEEREGIHTVTLAAVAAGLRGAEILGVGAGEPRIEEAVRAHSTGRLRSSWDEDRVDASLVAVATPFRLLPPDDPVVAGTVAAVESELVDERGVQRYLDDEYYGGGKWLLLAALLGLQYFETGREDEAYAQLEWVAAQAAPDGALPEQVPGHLLRPDRYEDWVARWGPPASPLLWSHAFLLDLALALGEVAPR